MVQRKISRKTSRRTPHKTSSRTPRIRSRKTSSRTSRKTSSNRRSNRTPRKTSSSRRSSKTQRKSDDDKIKEYFRRKLKKQNDYLLTNVWIHPISGKPGPVSDKAKRLFKQAKDELNIRGKRCNVKKSKTNNREDLIKELKAYVKCWEKKTGRNQDLSSERLKEEPLSAIKKHLKFYRENNII